MMIKKVVYALSLLVLVSCKGKLDKLLLSNDVAMKEQKAFEYFEKEDYASASPLFKDLIQSYSTSAKVEEMYFYYSYCDYLLEDYMLAAYEFKKITQKFPKGKYAEKAQFLIADSYYKTTPKYNLDQEYNAQSVEEFQVFLEKYPRSARREEVNRKIDELFEKREKKAFENAKLYYNTGDYKSAIQSFQFVLNDFPDTKRDEELKFLMVESAYLYAEKSTESKKTERYLNVNQYAENYLKSYETSTEAKYVGKVKTFQIKSGEKAKEWQSSLPKYYLKKKRYEKAIEEWEVLLKKETEKEIAQQMAEDLLTAHYEKGINSPKTSQIEAVDDFLLAYDRLIGKMKQGAVAEWKSKWTYFNKLKKELPTSLPFELLERGDYKNSTIFFKKLIDTADLKQAHNDKIFYYHLLAKHKYASKLYELPAKVQWDEIVNQIEKYRGWEQGSFKGKVLGLQKVVQEELAKYPVITIKNPMKRKHYGEAIKRAKAQIELKNAEKDQEEIVYLLLLSSVKKAKSVSKYERLPQYEYAKSLFTDYSSLLKGGGFEEKSQKIEEKIDKGLIKYRKK